MKLALVFLVGLILLIGCAADSKSQLIGVWTSDEKRVVIPPIPDEKIAKNLKLGLSNMILKMRSDGTFVATSGLSIDGRWKLEGLSVIFTVKQKKEGRFNLGSLISEMAAEVDPGFKKMTVNFQTPAGPVVVVLRKTA